VDLHFGFEGKLNFLLDASQQKRSHDSVKLLDDSFVALLLLFFRNFFVSVAIQVEPLIKVI
jgi:hypothetical protein